MSAVEIVLSGNIVPLPDGVQSAQGIDVSNFQGNYDWAAAAEQVPDLKFGVYRLTQGLGGPGTNSPDPFAEWNHAQIGAHGLHRGAYHFLDPFLGGHEQAEYFVTTASKLGIAVQDMFFEDNETPGASPASTSQVARDFMTELVALLPNHPRAVYTFIDFAKTGYCQGLGGYDLWLAYPNLTAPVPPPPWVPAEMKFWQWGQRKGADTDAFMGTADQLDQWVSGFLPKHGPFRQVAHGGSLSEIAKRRATTPEHLLAVSAGNYTEADKAALFGAPLHGVPYYTTNP